VPHSQFWCDTTDGVRLAGSQLGDASASVGVVLVHGFMGYRTKPPQRILAEALADRFCVFTFDLRGHGQSSGACSGGEYEPLDVHAVVQHARRKGFERVVTVGGSLGGIAVIREAAMFRDVAGVVSISTPAQWGLTDTAAVRRATWIFTSRIGRALAKRVMGTTIDLDWRNPEPPEVVVARIAPTPLLLVHGADDHFFSVEQARRLYERAGEPKRLLILDEFGHAEDGYTSSFAARLCDEIVSMVER
jgi:pimeloyl-ACP methyl ester carboxylesterase